MVKSQIPNPRDQGDQWARWEWGLLPLIFLLAVLLRVCCLDLIPPGFTHDEAGHGHDAVAILQGARPIYQTVGYGREPLYDYLLAGLMVLFGPGGGALRFSAVPLSLIVLLGTFAWVRMAFDRPTALAAAALQAVSFWTLATSRQALRSGLLPALLAAAVYWYWQAVYGSTEVGEARLIMPSSALNRLPAVPHLYRWGMVALLIGATLYTYVPARVSWVIFPVFLIYLALFHRPAFRRAWLPTLLAISAGLLLAVPLFAYLQAHPEAEQRLTMLDAPLQALQQGDPSVIMERAWSCLTGLVIPGQGDGFLAYNIPGRPTFDALTGVLFLAGVALCAARWRRPACAFALIWLLVGISPSLITGATASFTRAIAAQPVAFLFPALAAVATARWAAARWKRWGSRIAVLAFVGLVIAVGALSARAYFITWGESPHVRAAYQHTLVEAAGYLDASDEGGTVAISTVYPHAPHDPYVFDMSLARRDLSLRWFDARRALVLPPQSAARLIAPASAPLDGYFAELPGLGVRERVDMWEDDLDPHFVVYDWQPQAALAALQERAVDGFSDPALPVDFGPSTGGSTGSPQSSGQGALQLIGYDLRTPEVAPGGTVELVTLWLVIDPQPLWPRDLSNAEEDLVLFTHALDETGAVVGQEDRLDAPAWDWQAGDVVVQIHRFALLTDLPPGLVVLEVGLYRRSDQVRFPVLADGEVVGDRVLLQPVEIVSDE